MSRTDNFESFQEGPLFPDEAGGLVSGLESLLAATTEDTRDAVAKQNVHDRAEASFRDWMRGKLDELGYPDINLGS